MSTSTQGIVVGYDDSPDSRIALAWAVESAARTRLPVLAVTVAVTESRRPQRAVRWGEAHLADVHGAAARFLAESGLPDAVAELRRGAVVPTLLEAANEAAMLVVGSSGHGQVSALVEGSVSQELPRRAHCPVVVVRPQQDPGAARIVVGLDGSAGSQAALEFACRRAEATQDSVLAVQAEPADSGAGEQRMLEEALVAARTAHPSVVLNGRTVPESARHALVEESGQASLVVVGARGRGAVTGLLLGSVSQAVLSRARCPVAIAH